MQHAYLRAEEDAEGEAVQEIPRGEEPRHGPQPEAGTPLLVLFLL